MTIIDAQYLDAYDRMFNQSPILGWRDIAAACEDTNPMAHCGPHHQSFLASNLLDPVYDNQFAPLIRAIVMHGVPA